MNMEAVSETERTLVITRDFAAPRELVFEAWTDARHLAQWCAPAVFTIAENSADVRRGGVWWSLMRAPNGEECRASGVYREIVAPERLVFSYAHDTPDGSRGPETLVTVTFEVLESGTRLTLRQATFDTVMNRNEHDLGWGECMDRLAAYLAKSAA